MNRHSKGRRRSGARRGYNRQYRYHKHGDSSMQQVLTSNRTQVNTNKTHKKKKWRKVVKIESMDNIISEKVIFGLNYIETIFAFLNFLDLIGICSLLSRYHYEAIFFNQKNIVEQLKNKQKNTNTSKNRYKNKNKNRKQRKWVPVPVSKVDHDRNSNKNNINECRYRYPNRIFEICFKNTFKNLIKHVIEPSMDILNNKNEQQSDDLNSLPKLTILRKAAVPQKNDERIPSRIVEKKNKRESYNNIKTFEYNKKKVYPLFNDWFYLTKKIIESNVVFLKYGSGWDNIFGQLRSVNSYKNATLYIRPHHFDLTLLLAIGDAEFVQYWLTKVKIIISKNLMLECLCF